MDSSESLDLDHGVPVTPDDIAALRRVRMVAPSWFALSWRELVQLVPPTVRQRPTATDDWQPFTLA